MVEAKLTAECPYCGALLQVVLGTYMDTQHGGCKHAGEISRIEGQIYVEFTSTKKE